MYIIRNKHNRGVDIKLIKDITSHYMNLVSESDSAACVGRTGRQRCPSVVLRPSWRRYYNSGKNTSNIWGAWNASTYLYFHKIKVRTSIYCRKRVTAERVDTVSWNNTLDIKIGELIYRPVGLNFCKHLQYLLVFLVRYLLVVNEIILWVIIGIIGHRIKRSKFKRPY